MKSRSFSGPQTIHFRQWSRKAYAVFNSLKSIVKIGRLELTFSILTLAASAVVAQSNTMAIPGEDVELDELEVTAQSEPLVFSQHGRMITTITKQEIESAPVSDLAGLLSFVQSVDIRQRGGQGVQADVSIRGGSFDQVLVLINGIPVTDPQTGHFNLNIPVDISDIQKVEVLKGPGARVFGPNAFSGAINIITKAEEGNHLSARLMGGQNGLYHYGATGNFQVKNWKTRVSYDQKASDGYMENTDFKSYSAFLQSSLQLKALLMDAQLGFMQKDFGANSFYSPKYPMQYESNQSRNAALGFHFGNKVRVSILPYYRQHRDNWQLTREKPELYQNFHQTDVYGGRAKMIFYSQLGKTTVGLNIKREHLLSSSMGEKLDMPESISWAKNQQFKYSFERDHAGLYVEQSKELGRKWQVSLGLLAHWYSTKDQDISVYPGLDISYKASPELKLIASANNAMRLPTFTDLFYSGPANMGNTELNPEKSFTLELGAEYNKPGYQIQAAVFRRYGNDIIDWVWHDTIWRTENITELSTNGIELATRIQPDVLWNVKFWKKMNLDYTYLDMKKEDLDIQSKYALNNLRHQFNVVFQFELIKNMNLQITSSYKDRLGSYQTYNIEESQYEDHPYENYWSINAKLSYQYKSTELFVEANNINDVQVIEFGVPQPGLWILGGVKHKLDF